MVFAAGVLLVGCSQFPELENVSSPGVADSPYPRLVPIDRLAADRNRASEVGAETEAALAARVARLRARADRLRGAVIDPASQNRLTRQGS